MPVLTDATECRASPSAVGELPAALPAGGPVPDFDGFLAEVERRAFRLAQLALGQREDALDAVQDAMLRLLRYRNKPPGEWPPLFWSILRRQLTDRHRRNAVKRRVLVWFGREAVDGGDALEMHADPHQDPARQHADTQAWQALGRALRQLPRRQRECFLLRELQGLSVAETAQAMACSEGSVKTHLSRANSALRTHLEDWQ